MYEDQTQNYDPEIHADISDISYHNFFVPTRFVPRESLTLALPLTIIPAITRNSNTNT